MLRYSLILILPAFVFSCQGKEKPDAVADEPVEVVAEVVEVAAEEAPPVAVDESIRFATMDMKRVVKESQLGKEAARDLAALKALIDQGFERRKAEAGAIKASLDAAPKKTLADKRRAETATLQLQALSEESGAYLKRRLKQLKVAGSKAKTRVALASKKHLDAVAAEHGYVWVMDRTGESLSEIPLVLHVKKTHPDLTAEVIRRMDAE